MDNAMKTKKLIFEKLYLHSKIFVMFVDAIVTSNYGQEKYIKINSYSLTSFFALESTKYLGKQEG